MSEDDDKIGKQFPGQQFVPVITAREAAEQAKKQAAASASPDAIGFAAYCSLRGIRDQVTIAALRSRTALKNASPAEWDSLFEGHWAQGESPAAKAAAAAAKAEESNNPPKGA